ncbi:TetR/AcrR family transcriptional regulator [Streptomyces sp. MspMP-M5]|uniref:TetR/AcrR family transcriptional regulator n=1 Tax=unclassified Streptomyces TaxID=2593676 RepID=UPI000477A800|nr:TetR/AcrR family transcriptional regulator [Streptomyces sp. MspMP-M5]MYT32986.1 TetR family transcriptional regulator [Streptomyces sp. SID8354]
MRSKNRASGKQERTFIEAARRAQLVDCAIAAIADVGLHRASLAEIARRAGITKQAIFYHFATRDELIHEVLAVATKQGAEFMAARSRQEPTPADELRAYIEANVEYIGSHRERVKALVAIAMNFTDEDGRSRLLPLDASVYGDSLAPLQDILQRGQEQGQFVEFNTRTMAMSIRAAIDAIGPQLNAMGDLDLDSYARDLVELFDRATARGRT